MDQNMNLGVVFLVILKAKKIPGTAQNGLTNCPQGDSDISELGYKTPAHLKTVLILPQIGNPDQPQADAT